MICSISVAVAGGRKHRAGDDLQVEPERPIVDVEQVMLDALAHLFVGVDFAAIAVNLRPAGNARLDVVPAGVQRDVALKFVIV